jgi:hypothetical protein
MTAMYRKYTNKPWNFTGPGVVLVKTREIVVLEEGTHLTNAFPKVVTSEENAAKLGVATEVPFTEWFEAIDPYDTEVISTFKLNTTEIGDSLLGVHFLSNELPAVIVDKATRRNYYFAGDFATNDIKYYSSYFGNHALINKTFYSEKDINDPKRFFWLYYRPLMTSIFTDYYSTLK